jgi:hypothetical protein
MKKVYLLIAGVMFTLAGYSQTTQQPEKQVQDSQRRADAGKADVISNNQKGIFDSTTFNNNSQATENTTVKKSGKKKHCGNRTKRNNKAGTLKKKA